MSIPYPPFTYEIVLYGVQLWGDHTVHPAGNINYRNLIYIYIELLMIRMALVRYGNSAIFVYVMLMQLIVVLHSLMLI